MTWFLKFYRPKKNHPKTCQKEPLKWAKLVECFGNGLRQLSTPPFFCSTADLLRAATDHVIISFLLARCAWKANLQSNKTKLLSQAFGVNGFDATATTMVVLWWFYFGKNLATQSQQTHANNAVKDANSKYPKSLRPFISFFSIEASSAPARTHP